MKKIVKILSLTLVIALLLSGCKDTNNSGSNPNDTDNNIGNNNDSSGGAPIDVDFSKTDDDMFSGRDTDADYNANKSVSIQLNGSSASCNSNSVQIDGSTITLTEEGTYILSGTLDNGTVIVDADSSDKIQLVLDNATINSETSAPIYISEADKVFITLADGSSNTLSNGGTFTAIDENNIDAAVFSRQDLTFNGSGSLSVTSPSGHGIACKDDLVVTGGTYSITSSSHGLDANDSFRMKDANITIAAGKDGIHVENSDDDTLGFIYVGNGTLDICAEGDGISAGYYIQIEGGTFDLLCGGSTSMKGLKSGNSILINAGAFTIDSADDAIHSNASVYINNGNFTIASGDDAFHAEETLAITGGTATITKCYEGFEAIEIYISGGEYIIHADDDGMNAAGGTDGSGSGGGRDGMFGADKGNSGSANGNIEISGGKLTIYASGDGLDSNGNITISGGYTYVTNPNSGDTSVLDSDNAPIITGGTYIGIGITTMMAETFSTSSSQGVIACSVGSQAAGSEISITDADGNTVLSLESEYAIAIVIISTPDIVKGETYNLVVGTASGSIEAN